MTTPTGTISAQDVANEFGIGRPISFSAFYGRGGSQGSGAISLGDMRGRSAVIFSPASPSAESTVPAGQTASVSLTCSPEGVWTFPTIAGVTASRASGSTSTGVTFGRTVRGSATFTATCQAGGVSRSWTVLLEVSD